MSQPLLIRATGFVGGDRQLEVTHSFVSAGGGSMAWPFAARAQQPSRARTVGVLVGLASTANDPVAVESLRPFKDELQKAGWIEGKNIYLIYRFGGGDLARISSSAAELVALAPDLIYAQGLPATRAVLSVASAAERGALIAYTYDYDAMFRLPVSYIDRILKRDSPGSLPVQAPTKFELSINLKTANELGLKVPPTLLAITDKLIE